VVRVLANGANADGAFKFGWRSVSSAAIIGLLSSAGFSPQLRKLLMDTPTVSAAMQVALGGILVFATGVLIGSS
jgi:hypothetical protein